MPSAIDERTITSGRGLAHCDLAPILAHSEGYSRPAFPTLTRHSIRMPLKLAFVAQGDANTADCWSGSGRAFVEALRATGATVDVFDAELRSWPRAIVAALTFHPRRARWRQRYELGTLAFHARSRRIERALRRSAQRYDAVIQVGAMFRVNSAAREGASYIIYCDSNLAFALRGAPYSAASRLARPEIAAALRRERRVYDMADRIWTFSDALARSFRDDFGQAAAKLTTIYGGANFIPDAKPGIRPLSRILFVGKDHLRKGSEVLLRAFAAVRQVRPGAELHMVGGRPANGDQPSVVCHGVVSRSSASGRRLMDELFETATVFCMPSRYEPFGVVFAEAMLAGLPCIGVDRWAMPEIIEHGRTGWLVPDGDADELARAMIAALGDAAACARMGAAGRERALALFTWERVAGRALADLAAARPAPGPVELARV